MARRGYGGGGYGSGSHDPDPDDTERTTAREGEAPVATEDVPVDPNPAKTKALADLDAYYAKVLGDLDREKREADAVHDASEKRMEQVEAQKVVIDAEYAERKAAIEAEYATDPPAQPPASRWGAPINAPAPKVTPALTS